MSPRAKRAIEVTLIVSGGLCAGLAIRDAWHGDWRWAWLALAAVVLSGTGHLSSTLPLRRERKRLLAEKARLLQLRAEIPGMVTQAAADLGMTVGHTCGDPRCNDPEHLVIRQADGNESAT